EEGGTLWRLPQSALCVGLAKSGLRGSPPGRQLRTGPHRRHRAASGLGSAKQYATHVVKKAARSGRPGFGRAALQCFDAGIGGLERLILDEHSLNERIYGVRRASQPIADRALGVGVAGLIFEFGQAVKQICDKLTFLRGHVALLWVGTRFGRRCRKGDASVTLLDAVTFLARPDTDPSRQRERPSWKKRNDIGIA